MTNPLSKVDTADREIEFSFDSLPAYWDFGKKYQTSSGIKGNPTVTCNNSRAG
jgi:hypothetical protein